MDKKAFVTYNCTQLSLCYSAEYNVKSVEYCSMKYIYAWHGSPMTGHRSVQRNLRRSIWTTFVWVNYVCSTNQWLRFLLQHIRETGNKQAWWTSTTLKYQWFPCKLKLYSWKGNNYSGEKFGSLPAYFSYSDTKQGCQGYLELHL